MPSHIAHAMNVLQLKALQDKLAEDRAALTTETETEKAEIQRQWQKLNDEMKRMEEIHNLQQVILRVVKKVTQSPVGARGHGGHEGNNHQLFE